MSTQTTAPAETATAPAATTAASAAPAATNAAPDTAAQLKAATDELSTLRAKADKDAKAHASLLKRIEDGSLVKEQLAKTLGLTEPQDPAALLTARDQRIGTLESTLRKNIVRGELAALARKLDLEEGADRFMAHELGARDWDVDIDAGELRNREALSDAVAKFVADYAPMVKRKAVAATAPVERGTPAPTPAPPPAQNAPPPRETRPVITSMRDAIFKPRRAAQQ